MVIYKYIILIIKFYFINGNNIELISSTLWLYYAILLKDSNMRFINGVGLIFQTIYIAFLYKFSNEKVIIINICFYMRMIKINNYFI
jgi:hypothetical protein